MCSERIAPDRPLQANLLCWLCLGLVASTGCSGSTFRANNDDVPSRYQIKSEHFVLHSDFKQDEQQELVSNLKQLRWQIGQTLDLELGEKKVQVYLFEDEVTYHKFLANHFPGLPPRRAYFVGTSVSLSIYTVWGERILEDLRHEFTHGVLHGALPSVPMWVDEGLAEYFETDTAPGTPRADYLSELNQLLKNGWRPDLSRLENLEAVGEMQRLDYAESWAWVHWMLHSHPQVRQSLLEYLKQPHTADAPHLATQMHRIHPGAAVDLVDWITKVGSPVE